MTQATDSIKATATIRKDGKVTVTVKLMGWEANKLTALEGLPYMQTTIARRIQSAVFDAYQQK